MRMITGLAKPFAFLTKLASSSKGNIVPMTAAAIFLLAGLVGGGVDISRAYMVENRLQNACDAGTLAGRRAIDTNGFDSAAQAQANLYFDTNFDKTQEGVSSVSFSPTTPDGGSTINGTATATLPTIVMRLFGYDKTNLSVTCSASMSVGNSDVVMVLDVTGSMDSYLSSGSTSSGGWGGSSGCWGGSGGWGGWGSSSWGGCSSSSGGTTSQTRLQALQAAMKNFYTTVHDATAGSNARVRYGFVPFSSAVNVGHIVYNLDPDYLADSWPIQSREWIKVDWGTTTYDSAPTCTYGWSNYGSPTISVPGGVADGDSITSSQTQRCNYTYTTRTATTPGTIDRNGSGTGMWLYHQITYSTSSYKAFNSVSTNTGTSGGAVSSTWAGCIQERTTLPADTISYSSTRNSIVPGGSYNPDTDKLWDLDIDAIPGTSDPTYGTVPKWGPQWPEVSYDRSTISPTTTGSQATSYCPPEAQILTEMDQTDFDNYADSLHAQGSTYLDIGMLWGARIASPQGIFSSNVTASPSNGGKVARHIIFMTDGYMQTSSNIQTSYGIEGLDRNVTTDGSTSTSDANHSERFRALCDAVKAKGIRIWVIGFTSGLTSDLSYCASDNSSFTANNADELNNAFQVIAKNVGELRIIS